MNTIKNHQTPHIKQVKVHPKRKKWPIMCLLISSIFIASSLGSSQLNISEEDLSKYFSNASAENSAFPMEYFSLSEEKKNSFTEKYIAQQLENSQLAPITLPYAIEDFQEGELKQSLLPNTQAEEPLYLATIINPFTDFFLSKPSASLVENPVTVPSAQEMLITQKEDKKPILLPYPENPRFQLEIAENKKILHGVVEKGDTFGILLNKWLSAAQIQDAIAASKDICSLTTIHIDRKFRIILDENNNFLSYEYEKDNSDILVLNGTLLSSEVNAENVVKTQYAFTATLEPIEYDIQLAHVASTLEFSLFDSVTKVGESAALAVQLANVFSYQIDFFRDPKTGDTFNVLVEKKYLDGEFKGYGDMLAAEYNNNNKKYVAYLFTDSDNKKRYYDASGEALEKLFLKTPLDFTRVSSGYTMTRKHPIFGDVRAHQGIDYAAPKGTPVRAIGDGTITFVGWSGGYGNTVIIKHANGFESQYAHLSGFAKDMKKGAKVDRGVTIAYVGATGTATGPHLDFRIKQNGKFVNPDSIIVPKAAPLTTEEKQTFFAFTAEVQQYFAGLKDLDTYMVSIQ